MSNASTNPQPSDPNLAKYKDQIEHILRWAEVETWECSLSDRRFKVNPRFFTKYDFTEPKVDHLTLDAWKTMIHPDDLAGVVSSFRELISGEKSVVDAVFRIMLKNGDPVYIHNCGGVVEYSEDRVPLRLAGTIQDVTRLKVVEEAVLRRDRLLEASNESARILLSSSGENFDQAIWKVLDLLGRATEVDRVYIWKNHRGEDNRLYTTQVYEWSLGAEPQQGNEFTVGIAFEEAIPTWEETLTADRCINSLVRNMPQAEQEQLSPQGIVSILVAPIMFEKEFWGFIGFDDCHQERVWSRPEEGILKSAGMLIASAIIREKTARALENERLFFQRIVETSPISIGIIRDGRLLLSNKRFYELSHLKPGDPISTSLVNPTDQFEILKAGHANGIVQNFNIQIRCPDNTIRDMLYTGFRIEYEGRAAILCWLVDITDLKRTEKELMHARDLAESGTQAKSEFLARMSHEIRTPMNAVLGLAYLCLQSDLSPAQRDYLIKIQTSATNLLGIIDDILDFSKIEAGKMKLEQIPFLLAETVREVAILIEQIAKEKGLELVIELQDIENEFLLGDPLRLRQILTNLLNNAVKFTETGSVTIAIQPVTVDPGFVTLRFFVKDTGIGMTQEQIQKLFQSFSQADGSTTRRYGGTGLGLVITKNFIELMGGTIEVESVPNQGTTFQFQLQFPKSGKIVLGERHALLSQKRVLVVDDDHTTLEIISNILQSLDMRVDTVDSGIAAISALTQAVQQGDPYQIMLLDWKMPRMDGLETIRQIRKAQEIVKLPQILMVSAYDRNECLRQASGLELSGFVVKPVTYSSIRDTICNALVSQSPVKPTNEIWDANQEDHVAGARVLLVEDNKINQTVASGLLKLLGVEVTIVDDGQQAVEAVSRQDFDLVLMDVQMPVMDGLTATREIRLLDKPGIDTLPIIAMTANALDVDYQRSLDSGMNDHLTKPIDPDKLRLTLKNWIVPRNK
ncbi:MAG: response regulator [Planctomycetaceae bacterium]|nr:response regulator [Planctomycetaceae bacterium]